MTVKKKMEKEAVPAAGQSREPVLFSKEQLLVSKKYANRRDMVDALLESSKKYTMKQVDELINSFMKGKVK